ncbi:MAG: proteasome assembly chaperone family protein [Candidatus Ranarchaeia archaeon]
MSKKKPRTNIKSKGFEIDFPLNAKLKIQMVKDVNFSGKIFITGFRSNIGQTGYIVIRHLIQKLGAKRVGFVVLDEPTPSVFMEEDKLATPFELYETDKFIILYPRLQPQRADWNVLSKGITSWILKNKIKEAILIGGLDIRFKDDESSNIKGASTSTYIKKLKKHNIELLDTGLGIFGPLALLLFYFEIAEFPAVALLPYAERDRPDPRAASIAIDYLNKICGMEIDNSTLLKHAKDIEKEINSIIEKQSEEINKNKNQIDYYT